VSVLAGKTAFQATMRNNDKPVPLKLMLEPRDAARLSPVSFTRAVFNTGKDGEQVHTTAKLTFASVF
jgi:hypothetical protein